MNLQKLPAGKLTRISRKLQMAVNHEVLVRNETGMDILLEQDENCDGSKPCLTLRIKAILHKEPDVQERGVL